MKAKIYCYTCGKDGEPFKAEGYLCNNSKCNNYLGKCESISMAQVSVIKFLKANGWERGETNDEFISFHKENNIGVDVGDDNIVLIGEAGDFSEHVLDAESIFWLRGRLLCCHAIAIDFKRGQGGVV